MTHKRKSRAARRKALAVTPAPVEAQTQKLIFPAGIAGVNLSQVERVVPAGEPPPLPVNAQLSVIGKPEKRIDARLKVTGAARYTADVHLPGMLYARMLRSPHPHARIRSINTSAAEALPGVRAVHVLDTVVGGAAERDPEHNNPKLQATGKPPLIRFVGQPVAAVAATTQAIADQAAKLIKVDYEVLPFVTDLDEAMKPEAPLVFTRPTEQDGTGGGGGAPRGLPQKGNVRGPVKEGLLGGPRGDVEKGLVAAAVTAEGEFRTQVQTHSPLETHGVVADWSPDLLTVYVSTQGVSGVRHDLAEVFGLPKSKVRVICEFMGGGFGAKFGPGNHGVAAAHLSRKAGAPVRLMLDRREQHIAVGNRPSTWQKVRMGASGDGTLTAIDLRAYGTAGVGLGAGVGWIAESMYNCPNFYGEQYDVFTHAGPGAAFRAPGAPQGAFAVEQLVDELAEKLGMDPVALRDKNDKVDMRREQRRVGAERFGWKERKPPASDPGPVKRGMGMAQAEWARFVDMDSSCEVRLTKDGSVEILSSVQDLGTGIRTVLAQVVAEELGLKVADITVRIGDTMYPAGPGSGGSKTTGSITPAARNAAFGVKNQLLTAVAPKLGVPAADLVMRDGRIYPKNAPGKGIAFKDALKELKTEQISSTASRTPDYGGFEKGDFMTFGRCGGVQFAQVSVDTETGFVHVDRVVAVHDCGRPMNPLQIESQINGGILQGISWALYENRHLDRNTGWMVNTNLDQYKILLSRETPEIEVVLLEEYTGRSSTDAMGVAEPANISTAAAVANAVYNAIGVRIYELPITPERILAALAQKPAGARPNKARKP
jgi:xanthine dehydrogenase YagR molybdenum-binding subunit